MLKKKFWKAIAPLMVATVLATSLIGCSGAKKSTTSGNNTSEKQTVKVGVMTALSGSNARMGEMYKSSITAAMKVIEEDNLLKNYKLEFEYVDDKGSTDGAPAAATYVLDKYKANVSIGHFLTTMILVSGPMFDDAEVPLLGIVSGPKSVNSGFKYTSIETGTDLVSADTLLEYLVNEKKFTKFGLIHINTEGGTSAGDRIKETLKNKYNLDLATRDVMTNDDSDYTAQVLKMKSAGVQTVIYWGMDVARGNILMKQIEQNWGKVPEDVLIAGGTNLAQVQMKETWTEKDIEGVVFPVGYLPDANNTAIQRFIKNFKEADPLHMDPADVPARVYDSVFHIVTALNNMGAYDVNKDDFNSKLNEALRKASFDGVQGHFDYGAFKNGEGMKSMNIGKWGSSYSQSKVYPK